MNLNPALGNSITIESKTYTFLPHPQLSGMVFAQEGRHAVVYQVYSNGKKYALKVYKQKYRLPNILVRAAELSKYSSLPGLSACSQKVITRETDNDLVDNYPDLEFAIIMPWIEGKTWFEVIFERMNLSITNGRIIAQKLARVLCTLEQNGLAHCNLAGTDVFVDFSNGKVSLIDFDEIFGSTLPEPIYTNYGKEGYTHKTQRRDNGAWKGSWEERGSWSLENDRFSGAILLVEMLTFHDDRIRFVADEEHYFSGNELQNKKTNSYQLVIQVLREQGDIVAAELFEKTWLSNSVEECPSLCDWVEALANPAFVSPIKKRPALEAKCTIVGEGSVGKTSLLNRIIHTTFNTNETKTEGVSINHWQVDEIQKNENQQSKISLNLWDFGGQEIMHATHQFFLTKRSLYLLVLDSRLTQEENRVEYWLKIIQSFGGESPVLIVGNKVDQHPLDIDKTGLQKKYSNIVGILETSAATGKGIEELKDEIARQVNILPHVRDLLPETWFTVKSKLEELAKNKNFFTQDEYFDLCNSNDVSDEISKQTLIGFLHDLGVVLHFQDDPRLENLGILNPQWVTNGVYKILNSHELFQNQGKLSLSLLNQILDLPEYPSNKRLFIVDMMKKFELCYDVEPDKSFLIPDLLPKDEPFTGEWEDALAFQIHYNVLPSSIISRFIVRMNEFIHKTVWRSGVVLKRGENTALVKADIEDKKIYIWINGKEDTRRDLLAIIRAEFEKIHKTIAKIEAIEKVPVPDNPEAVPVDYEFLVRMANEGRESLPVQAGNQIIDLIVEEVLSRIETQSKNYQLHIHGDVIGGNIISGEKNQGKVENIEKKKPRKKKS